MRLPIFITTFLASALLLSAIGTLPAPVALVIAAILGVTGVALADMVNKM